jgi:Serine/threonine protein kinase involved in cell cycle control
VKEEVVLLKIFRMETSSFGKREDYIRGDRRFSGKSTDVNKLIGIWCRKEYGNLKIAEEAGVMAPRPYYANGNVLAMEFIGEDGVPSPKLKDMKSEHPERIIEVIFESVRKLSSYGLVHGDMSEYNVLVKNNEPYIIDFGQAVSIDHPRAKEFLERDIHNIATFFRKRYGIEHDESKEVAKALEAADKGGST